MKKVFIDLGCFNGDTIIEFLKKHNREGEKWHVYGFDPNPYFSYVWRMIPGLYTNIEHIECHPTAAWDSDEIKTATIRPPDRPLGSSIMEGKVDWGQGEMIPTQCFDFSAWLKKTVEKEDYVYLKMDIEGAEYRVLDKMVQDGTLDLIDVLKIEWHDTKLKDRDYGQDHARLSAALKAHKIKVVNQMS